MNSREIVEYFKGSIRLLSLLLDKPIFLIQKQVVFLYNCNFDKVDFYAGNPRSSYIDGCNQIIGLDNVDMWIDKYGDEMSCFNVFPVAVFSQYVFVFIDTDGVVKVSFEGEVERLEIGVLEYVSCILYLTIRSLFGRDFSDKIAVVDDLIFSKLEVPSFYVWEPQLNFSLERGFSINLTQGECFEFGTNLFAFHGGSNDGKTFLSLNFNRDKLIHVLGKNVVLEVSDIF